MKPSNIQTLIETLFISVNPIFREVDWFLRLLSNDDKIPSFVDKSSTLEETRQNLLDQIDSISTLLLEMRGALHEVNNPHAELSPSLHIELPVPSLLTRILRRFL